MGLPTQTVLAEAAKPAIVGGPIVLVSVNVRFGLAPLALAMTEYGPPMVALAVTEAEAVVPPMVDVTEAGLMLAPEAGPVKVTTPPDTGSELALVTVTTNGLVKAVPTVALWLLPLVSTILKPLDSKAPISVTPTRLMPR
jgi:hypothetical protein